MAKRNAHAEVMAVCKVIRRSFHDSVLVYRYGGCYGFYLVLKHFFPTAIAYYDDKHKDHILTKIGDRFYDITGEVDCKEVCRKRPYWEEPIRLTAADHEHWEDCMYGQRLEDMLAKHASWAKKRAKED